MSRKGRLFERIVDPKTLWQAWSRVKGKGSSGGVDDVSIEDFERRLEANLKRIQAALKGGSYIPEPGRVIFIPKGSGGERRRITLPTIGDKIVQEAVRSAIEPIFDARFLRASYAYRPSKGPQKAIDAVLSRIKEGLAWACSADIDDFFDSIDHDILMRFVRERIWEEEILRLIELWVKMGVVAGREWKEYETGIPQGGVLSPLLSNVYLHPFDEFMRESGHVAIRYADDFLVIKENREGACRALREARAYLRDELHLELDRASTSVGSVDEGFVFLGVLFKGGRVAISDDKMLRMREGIRAGCREKNDLPGIIRGLNEAIRGWKRYYRSCNTSEQFAFLDRVLMEEITSLLKRTGGSEKDSARILRELEWFSEKDEKEKANVINLAIASSRISKGETESSRGRGAAASQASKEVRKKRREYERKISEASNLVVSEPGSFIGKTSKRAVVRVRGVKVREAPFFSLKNILVISYGVSISSDLVRHCMEGSIPIHFFDHNGRPYAQIIAPRMPAYGISKAQAEALGIEKGLHLARSFVEGKVRNQRNLIKYYHKYKGRRESAFIEECDAAIDDFDKHLAKIKRVMDLRDLDTARARLFGIEGKSAARYWKLIKVLLANDVYFEGRERRGASDLVNSMLNYGYGILYSQVYQAIILAGLNPNIGFLHREQAGKPVLVFDLIEEFRQPVVDRTIIGIIRKKEKLSMAGTALSEDTKKKIIEHVMYRLDKKVAFRGSMLSIDEILQRQADSLAGFLCGKCDYRPFVDRW